MRNLFDKKFPTPEPVINKNGNYISEINGKNEIILAEDGWREAALKAFRKKYKDGISADTKERLKQKNFLHNRGFTFKEIESVFS